MTKIVLTPEQAATVFSATEPVRIYCPDGSIAGWVSSTMHLPPKAAFFSPEEIAAAERETESREGDVTTQQMLESLRAMERS
jgi:hypothetical protein